MTNSFEYLRKGAEALGIKTVRLVIFQGGEPDEYAMPVEELIAFASRLRSGVITAVNAADLHGQMPEDEWARTFLNPEPNGDECAYCAAYGTCPNTCEQVREAVSDPVLAAFIDATAPADEPVPTDGDADARLAWAMARVDHLEAWCEAVRKEAMARALAGNPPPGYGLELGRQGNRKWRDPVAALEILRKRFRLSIEEACNLSVKSPTQVLELPEGTIGPRQIKVLEAEITRSPAKPALKPLGKIKTPWQPPEQAAAGEAFPELA